MLFAPAVRATPDREPLTVLLAIRINHAGLYAASLAKKTCVRRPGPRPHHPDPLSRPQLGHRQDQGLFPHAISMTCTFDRQPSLSTPRLGQIAGLQISTPPWYTTLQTHSPSPTLGAHTEIVARNRMHSPVTACFPPSTDKASVAQPHEENPCTRGSCLHYRPGPCPTPLFPVRTTAGMSPSILIRVRTHTMSDTSGIPVCFGIVQD
ncbi:hypothetical protein DFH07DRAFT_974714 [Mycena maculata]|uniref:Uncharacterized protein n=1 Tax=Mycena maculata TaxID=230809 RepID=A0AAD7H7N4_9AGAR|nr:hypothetical protein DFH07DRAFT_974714 [Mycena maculata]